MLQYPNGGYATMWVDTDLTITPQASGTIPEYKIIEGANPDNNSGSISSKVNKSDTSETTSSKTGDTNNMFLWFIILLVSGSVTIGTLIIPRKKKFNR